MNYDGVKFLVASGDERTDMLIKSGNMTFNISAATVLSRVEDNRKLWEDLNNVTMHRNRLENVIRELMGILAKEVIR